MLKIAICDSNAEYRRVTADLWSRAFFDTDDILFQYYGSGRALARDLQSGAFSQDILILDLLLPDVSGVRLLSFIREYNQDITIILQTEAEALAVLGYRYKVFDFIVKHRSLKEVTRVINRYQAEKMRSGGNVLTVSIQGSPQRLSLDRIIFFESEGRRIRAVGPGEDAVFYMKMDALEDQIKEAGFLRCHQSYLVNSRWIRGCASGILKLTNRNEIPVSRRYQKEIRAFLDTQAAAQKQE